MSRYEITRVQDCGPGKGFWFCSDSQERRSEVLAVVFQNDGRSAKATNTETNAKHWVDRNMGAWTCDCGVRDCCHLAVVEFAAPIEKPRLKEALQAASWERIHEMAAKHKEVA